MVKVSLLNSSPWITAASTAGRWLLYIGLALLVGAASTVLLVFDAHLPHHGLGSLRVAVAVATLGAIGHDRRRAQGVGVRFTAARSS